MKNNNTVECQFCKKIHEQKHFSSKIKEEIFYEQDLRDRKRICMLFHKTIDDFNNENEYDNYLEELEDKISVVVNGGPEGEKQMKLIEEYSKSFSNLNKINERKRVC